MKKIALVTGATGFIGSHLVRRLLKENYRVHILTRKTSDRWRIKDVFKNLHDYSVDLCDKENLLRIIKIIKPDYIFHTAAAGIHNGKSLPDKKIIEINTIGLINLIESLDKINYKAFINTGSSSEYGKKDKKMKENDICEPINAYGISKCAATLYSSFIAKTRLKPIITLRLFSPYGSYDDRSRLVVYTINQAIKNNNLKLAIPTLIRDFVYIDDVIGAYLKSMDRAEKYKGEIFNVGSGVETKICSVVEKIIKLTDSKSIPMWNCEAPRLWEPKHWQADISKAKKLLEWQPKHNLESGLSKTINWFKRNQKFYAN